MKLFQSLYKISLLLWLEQDADNAKVTALIPVWAIHIRAGLGGTCGSLPSQNILCDLCVHLTNATFTKTKLGLIWMFCF